MADVIPQCSCGPVDVVWPQIAEQIDPPGTPPIIVHDPKCEEVTGRPAPWETPTGPVVPAYEPRIESVFDRMAEQDRHAADRDLTEQWWGR